MEGEEIVNIALVQFLESVTIHLPDLPGEWLPKREALIVYNLEAEKVYDASMDGLFNGNRA